MEQRGHPRIAADGAGAQRRLCDLIRLGVVAQLPRPERQAVPHVASQQGVTGDRGHAVRAVEIRPGLVEVVVVDGEPTSQRPQLALDGRQSALHAIGGRVTLEHTVDPVGLLHGDLRQTQSAAVPTVHRNELVQRLAHPRDVSHPETTAGGQRRHRHRERRTAEQCEDLPSIHRLVLPAARRILPREGTAVATPADSEATAGQDEPEIEDRRPEDGFDRVPALSLRPADGAADEHPDVAGRRAVESMTSRAGNLVQCFGKLGLVVAELGEPCCENAVGNGHEAPLRRQAARL